MTTRSASVTTKLPDAAPGIAPARRPGKQYGTRAAIDSLLAIALEHSKQGGPALGIGDISLKGGGPMKGHASHKLGRDVDVRPLRKDGKNLPVTIDDPQYDRDAMRRLLQIVKRIANPLLVFFNDRTLQAEGLCREWPGHRDHFHIRFRDVPDPALEVLKRGDSGPQVRELQNALVHLGFKLKVDGDFGPVTEKYVKVFQGAHGLEQDGKVGPATRAIIARELAKEG